MKFRMTDGRDIIDFIRPLVNLPRSATGNGVRRTLDAVSQRLPIEVREYASGKSVFDWVVPDEWNLRRATLSDSTGNLLADTNDCVLHVMAHSMPFNGTLSLEELMPSLYSNETLPGVIPYRTSYYAKRWGICLSHEAKMKLKEGSCDVSIDADLFAGHLTLGELLIPGKSTDEMVISTHICHPFMANDNLAGLGLAVALFEWLSSRDNRLSYRLILAPGTIGAITWLAHNTEHAKQSIRHGLIATCVGDRGVIHYKHSRSGEATIDRAVKSVLESRKIPHKLLDFSPYGYDERQYNSPGFDLDFGVLSRSPNGGYPQYHTSADDLSILSEAAIDESLAVYKAVIELIDEQTIPQVTPTKATPIGKVYRSTNLMCEPMLGKRGLYKTTGGAVHSPTRELALLWVMNLADGHHGVADIVQRSKLSPAVIDAAVEALVGVGLLE